MPAQAAFPSHSGLLARLGFAACCAALLLALSDQAWRLGLPAAWDEVGLYSLLQSWREGASLPFGFGRGALSHHWLALFLSPSFSGPRALRIPVLLALGLEARLLWGLAKRQGGSPAAFGALAAHALGGLTLLRLHTTLGFAFTPLWALLAFLLAEKSKGPLAILAGFASAWLLCDHEALPFLLPGLLALLTLKLRSKDGQALYYASGLGGGLGLVAWISAPQLSHFFFVRGVMAATAVSPLREGLARLGLFFFGPDSAFALWALPFVFAGFSRLSWPQRLAILFGLFPLLMPYAPSSGFHRAAVAWPFLCLAAGLGFARALEALQSKVLRAALVSWALLGALISAGFFQQARARRFEDSYEYGRRLRHAAKIADKAVEEGKAGGVLSELNLRPMGAFRIFQGRPGDPFAGKAWVLLSSEQTGPRPATAWGSWIEVREKPGQRPLWLLEPKLGQGALWKERSQAISLWHGLLAPLGSREQLAVLEKALRDGVRDSFVRSVLLDKAIWITEDLRVWPRGLLEWAAAQKDLSARQCLAVAWALSGHDLSQALELSRRALSLDPSREGAKRLKADLEARLKGRN